MKMTTYIYTDTDTRAKILWFYVRECILCHTKPNDALSRRLTICLLYKDYIQSNISVSCPSLVVIMSCGCCLLYRLHSILHFSQLPQLGRHYVMRMLFIEQPVSQAAVSLWVTNKHAKWVHNTVNRLLFASILFSRYPWGQSFRE